LRPSPSPFSSSRLPMRRRHSRRPCRPSRRRVPTPPSSSTTLTASTPHTPCSSRRARCCRCQPVPPAALRPCAGAGRRCLPRPAAISPHAAAAAAGVRPALRLPAAGCSRTRSTTRLLPAGAHRSPTDTLAGSS
jgi:hypothetical protein